MAISTFNWTKTLSGTYNNISEWISLQSGQYKSLAIGEDVVLESNLTFPSNIDIVQFFNGAKFSGSYTLNINKMSAVPRHQIFDSTVNVNFGSSAITYNLPEWYGSGNGNVAFTSGNINPQSKVYIDGGLSVGDNLVTSNGDIQASNNILSSNVYTSNDITASGNLNTSGVINGPYGWQFIFNENNFLIYKNGNPTGFDIGA